MIASQANRNIAVETPLGPEALLLESLDLHEQLSYPFELTLHLRSQLAVENLESLLGEGVSVLVRLPGERLRHLHGLVRRISEVSMEMDLITYEAEVVPWFALLQLSKTSRIYHEKTVPEILKAVFNEAGYSDYRFDLIRNYDTLGICTQYDESHFAFASRLMEQEGIAYYFEHTAEKHTLVLCDDNTSYSPVAGCETLPFQPYKEGDVDIERVVRWQKDSVLERTSLTLDDYDYTTPRLDLSATHAAADHSPPSTGDWYEAPGYYETESAGERYAHKRMEAIDVSRRRFHGAARCAALSVGKSFNLVDTPWARADGEYLLTSLHLKLQSAEFTSGVADDFPDGSECQVSGIPKTVPFRPTLRTPRPRIHGVQSAVVVGPNGHDVKIPYTTTIGSVKVQFHWDREGKQNDTFSGWMRVSQIIAGEGWGSMFIPRIGNEVLVGFEYGDPDRPVIVGALYNGVNQPALELPQYAQRCYINDDGGNALAFVPDQGQQAIVVYSPTNDTMHVVGSSHDPHAHTPPAF